LFGIGLVKKLQAAYVLILLQLLLASIAEIAGQVIKYRSGNNTSLFNVYILLECSLLMTAIVIQIGKKAVKNMLPIGLFIFICSWIIAVAKYGISVFALSSFLISCFILTLSSLVLIMRLAANEENPLSQPSFWICCGMVIYFGPIIPLFSLFNYFQVNGKEKLGSYLYTINDILAMLRYSLTFYGLYLLSRSKNNLQ
jgi:hypothetical protein